MYAYLDLVARTDSYSFLKVTSENGENFLTIAGPKIGALDNMPHRMGLIGTNQFSYPIIYDGQKIGLLEGERYTDYVYFLFYLLLSLFFSAITLVFILYLFFHRRILKQQVKERTQKYQELVNLLPEMVIETDAEYKITFANEKALECFGLADIKEVQPDCSNFIFHEHGGNIGNSHAHNETSNSNFSDGEYRLKCSSGKFLPVLVRSAPMYNDGHRIGARMVIVDIAERKALEEQLNQDQKMKSIGMMASGIAHDLNNILSGIVNYPELLLHQIPPESRLVNLIKPMQKAGLRAAAVVADLLTVARGVAATKKAVNINDIIQEHIDSPEFKKLKSSQSGIRYEINLTDNLSPVSCSAIHVKKSLMNLMNNASEAIKDRGQVTIRTENKDLITPIKTVHGIIAQGSYVVLTVQDTGQGIPHEDLLHIFEPFYSKKELGRSGTGLGLAIVWNTMQDHNGNIDVKSNEHGSTFKLYFPRTFVEKEVIKDKNDREIPRGNGESILVVDDEPQQIDIAKKILQGLGYAVEGVSSGYAAMEYVRRRNVDLVLLDMIMETGMNGLQTYTELIQIRPDQKAIILSGFSESDDVKKTMLLGAGGLINKPYTMEQLGRAVYKELNKDGQ